MKKVMALFILIFIFGCSVKQDGFQTQKTDAEILKEELGTLNVEKKYQISKAEIKKAKEDLKLANKLSSKIDITN